ncbi:MAG: hypothetical protein IPM98_20745 [Lewinellaceae bacterium]|nr:hypothetical protein [Lewinellaceae bacterium]
MDTLFKLAIFFLLMSCKDVKLIDSSTPIKYQDWKPHALKKMTKELVTVCNNWPKEWGKCPDGINDSICIASVDIDKNIIVIKSILDSQRGDYEIVILQQFIEGFNSWHCETFLTDSDNTWRGKEICKSSISGNPEVIKAEEPIEKIIVLDNSELDYYWNLKSGTFSSNGIIAITIIDKQLNILKCNIVLYP